MSDFKEKLKDDAIVVFVAIAVAITIFVIWPRAIYVLQPETAFRRYPFEANVTRILFMFAGVGSGFLFGWSLSAHANQFRRYVFWGGSAICALIAASSGQSLGLSLTWLIAIVGFFVGAGLWTGNMISRLSETPNTFGSTRWANVEDLENNGIYGKEGFRLGKARNRDGEAEVISYKGDRHLLTVAPTRAGKGTTQIVPNLLTYEGSALVIDPKGENAAITAARRHQMGQEVHIVDPWGVTQIDDLVLATFNPLDWLDKSDVDLTENAMILADALVESDGEKDRFWDEEAKALLQGIILYVVTDPVEDGQRHLGRVRDLLLQDGELLTKFFKHMLKSDNALVAGTGARCIQKDEKLLANVFATAQAHTHFLDSKRIRQNLSTSSFKFEDLKTSKMTIYLVLPADRLSTFGRWFRLLVQQALTVNARNISEKPEKPVLFLLDEFAALGRLSMVEQAYGLMAGFGIQLWGIIQDLNQLERIYGASWQSFIANAGMINYFGSTDYKTAEYFSNLCGEQTVWSFSTALARTAGSSSGAGGGTSSYSETETDTHSAAQRKLIYPDELMRLDKRSQLIFIDNVHPIRADKVSWRDDDELKDLGVDLYASDNAIAKEVDEQ